MHHLYVLCIAILLISCPSIAQHSHQDILAGQTGNSLINALRTNYKPLSLPSYGQARDNMYKHVYRENDTVTCVYTGLKRYLPPLADPSTAMADNNSSVSINAEHTYPQGKTINSAGKSDLHHMFPTRAAANTGRASLPLGDIVPNNVDKWYFEATTRTSPPPANLLDLHSKQQTNVLFEPREDHKGNAARAMFYYYTMYQAEANASDPNFFHNQKATLCQWHLADPVDSLEWIRTSRIALFQNNRVNPFVMDCTLPERCGYCATACSPPNSISRQEEMGLEIFDNYPNPFEQKTTIHYQLNRTQEVVLKVYNSFGQMVQTLASETQTAGLYEYTFEAQDLASGLYFYQLILTSSKGQRASFSKPLVIR